MRSGWMKSLVAVAVVAIAFVAGSGWAVFQLWPYGQLRQFALEMLRGDPPTTAVRSIATNLATLELTTFDLATAVPGIARTGGGIDAFGDDVLVMSYRGGFYLYRGAAADVPITPLDIGIDNGYAAYRDYVARSRLHFENADSYLRFIDVVYDQAEPQPSLWVTHHQWHDTQACYTLRLSRLALEAGLPLERQSAAPEDWRTVYETVPCLPLDASAPVFNGHQSGGRIVVVGPDAVLVTVGDHAFDGWNYDRILSQDPAGDYGKILLVTPGTGTAAHLSIGHRNPQGLLVARDGSIWSTEHGPRGGDELNLIVDGGNYGWPYVTYGVQYGMTRWPLSETQNRHDGYTQPVYAWFPSIGVSNLIQVDNFLPAWDGDLLVSSLAGQTLHRLRYQDGRIVFDEPIRIGERIRDLDQLGDGTIVIWTNAADILELRPGRSFEPDLEQLLAALPEPKRHLAMSTIGTCLQCHEAAPDAGKAIAPNLWGIFGRRIAGTDFAAYSDALRGRAGRWNEETLDAFLSDVQGFSEGSTMSFPGIGDAEIRAAVIQYLQALR